MGCILISINLKTTFLQTNEVIFCPNLTIDHSFDAYSSKLQTGKKIELKNITRDTEGAKNQEKTQKCLPLFKTIFLKFFLARTLKFVFFAPKRTKYGVDLM